MLAAVAGIVPLATPALAQDISEADAERAMLQAQLDALQEQIKDLSARLAKAEKATSWKGAPQQAGGGFDFKMRGRIQYDMGTASSGAQGDDKLPAADQPAFNSDFRRLIFGAAGSLPGGFKYKADFDFAGSKVNYEDVILTWAPADSPFSVTLGNHYSFSGLETMTSSGAITFIERSQANEAFNHSRRLGVSAGFAQGDFMVNAGVFPDWTGSSTPNGAIPGVADDSLVIGARAVYSPKLGENQLHVGVNYQHRENDDPERTNQYKTRPFTRVTDTRLADTGGLTADGDAVYGAELAGVFGPLYAAGEYQRLTVSGSNLANRPSFSSWYVEGGYVLTGESRGYKNGAWLAPKVANPFDKGGPGAILVSARIDQLDLNDGTVLGGKQTGYGLSMTWLPIDYVKFLAQYVRVEATKNSVDTDADIFGLRAQVEW